MPFLCKFPHSTAKLFIFFFNIRKNVEFSLRFTIFIAPLYSHCALCAVLLMYRPIPNVECSNKAATVKIILKGTK
jgi:hypothetical protein